MSATEVAQPPSPPTLGTDVRLSPEQQSSGSSSLRLSDEQDKKSPALSSSLTVYLRGTRRRSDCTENGSIGYGSSAPLESETSYSSHPGYPSKLGPNCKSPPQPHNHKQIQQVCSGSQSSSTPSSSAYVDVEYALSSTRLAGGGVAGSTTTTTSSSSGSRRPRNALVYSRANGLSIVPPASSWTNSPATYAETGYVVDSGQGNAYVKGQLLGKGAFAKVYLITDIATRKQYACKIMPKHQLHKIHVQKIAREIKIHKELNHINVVKMHHYFEDSLNVYMLLEACPKKSLEHVLRYRGKVTEPEARYYMKQMVSGLGYIHSQKVVHRDLKPGNMFLSDRMVVKIGDFGLATQPDSQRRRVTICGTPNFIAPEVLFKQACSYEADVWALGCILYALLVGWPPFEASTLKETYSKICGRRYKELDDTMATRAGQDLVSWLLQSDPELRPPLEFVNQHPYLTREFVPASLPESCCYQAPRLSFIERASALASLAPSLTFTGQHNQNPANQQDQQQGQQQAQEVKKAKSKKKKVSSWLASWRLPKLPRFRQRISSVLCLEARKKQQQQAGEVGAADEATCSLLGASQSQLMSRALEECIAGVGRMAGSCKRNPTSLDEHTPLFVTKWMDYSNKYGLVFQLSDRSVGVLFNDSTKMSYTHDRRRVEYITADDQLTRYNWERNVPAHLQEKLYLLRHFTDYMDKHLQGGQVTTELRGDGLRRSVTSSGVPLMRRWLRTSKAIVMEMNVPLLQMNFFDDHTKLIVSQEAQSRDGNGYLVTYIDCERRASTYRLNDLRDHGCTVELQERLLFVYKVAKEFAELDAAQTH